MKRVTYATCLLIAAGLLSGCQTNHHYDVPAVTAFCLIVLIIVMFLLLANYSNILRDEISDCDEFEENAKKIERKQKRRLVDRSYPFSQSKVQFGVWTVIISSSYIFLSLCKGDCAEGPINKTALVLMGIFAGTAAASALMDKKEINNNQQRHQNTPSQGFFIDILSDDNGISLHRFQNFVWTLIAMAVYLYKVFNIRSGCVLPELSDTLLALTGISSATYLLLRSSENNPPIQEAQASGGDDADKKPVLQDPANGTSTTPRQQTA